MQIIYKLILMSCYIIMYVLSANLLAATPQSGDYLIVEDDTLYTYSILPSAADSIERQRYYGYYGSCLMTSSYRGYYNLWELRNDSLFLVGMRNACTNEDRVFSKRGIFANWIDSPIYVSRGERLKYEHQGFGWYYEREEQITFVNGKRVKSEILENSDDFHISQYEDKDTLWSAYCAYIKTNATRDFDPADQDITIVVGIRTDEKGYITETEILRSGGAEYDEVAVNMIRSIERFSAYYRFGKFVLHGWTFPINFKAIDEYCK